LDNPILYDGLLFDLEALSFYLASSPPAFKQPLSALVTSLKSKLSQPCMRSYLDTYHSRTLDNNQREAMTLLYRERNKTLLEIERIHQE
jgi:hypothetical protein